MLRHSPAGRTEDRQCGQSTLSHTSSHSACWSHKEACLPGVHVACMYQSCKSASCGGVGHLKAQVTWRYVISV